MDFYNWLNLISYILSSGYLLLTPLLILLWLILKRKRVLIVKWIAISNGWFVVGNLILMISLAMEFIAAWYNQNQYEGYSFYYSRTNIFSPYGFSFWLHLSTIPASIFFLFKRVRRSILVTLIFIAVIIFTNERFILFVTSFYRDYLPSSWVYTTPIPWWQNDAFYFIIYLLVVSISYVIQKRKEKITI